MLSEFVRLCENIVVKISAAIITLNEEKRIGTAIDSVKWADEVVVVDSGSTDRTVEIAESKGAKVYQNDWPGFGRQKQYAADKCGNDWILSIDADEWISESLKEEIHRLFADSREPSADAFLIPRETIYMGRKIRHSGWYPDHQLRLFRKSKGRWKDLPVHESVEMNGATETVTLKGTIGHVTVESAYEHYRMIGERYAPLGADKMSREGRTTSPLGIAVSLPAAFLRSYVLKLGVLDGFPGFCIAVLAAYNEFLKRLLLFESQKAKSDQ